jgi:uncharacterized membrane protein
MALAQPPRPRVRIDLIDVARGAAMLLVFLSHFLEAYFDPFPSHPQAYKPFVRISTPAFMCVSGLTLAVLFARNRDRFGPTRDRLIDRGLFLIIVGHPIFLISYFFMNESWQDALRVVFVTDTIGFAVIVGSLLITRLGPGARLALGLALLALGWTTLAAWNPPIPSLAWRIKDFLVGDWRERFLTYNFPPVLWFGLYLAASAVGARFAHAHETGTQGALPRRAAMLGLCLLSAAAGVHFGLKALAGGTASGGAAILLHFADPLEKLPPSPTFMLFYVGLVTLLLAALMLADRSRAGRWFSNYVVIFGRNSLPAFLIQSFVYFMAVQLLPRPPQFLLPVYFAVTVVFLRAAVAFWERKKLNRLLTVGYARNRLKPAGPQPPPEEPQRQS